MMTPLELRLPFDWDLNYASLINVFVDVSE